MRRKIVRAGLAMICGYAIFTGVMTIVLRRLEKKLDNWKEVSDK